MLACAKSTGAMLPCCSFCSASGSSRLRMLTNWRRVADGAVSGRGRQTRAMDEARALVPLATVRYLILFALAKCQ